MGNEVERGGGKEKRERRDWRKEEKHSGPGGKQAPILLFALRRQEVCLENGCGERGPAA